MLRCILNLRLQPTGLLPRGPCQLLGGAGQRHFSSRVRAAGPTEGAPPVVQVDYHSLMKLEPGALERLREAFVGPKAYGAIAVVNIPGYGGKLKKAFRAGIDLALTDAAGRERAAAVNNTYPGWSGVPGKETHPLQSSFLYNVKEEVNGRIDPYFGKNLFPSKEFQNSFVDLATPMHGAALQVLKGCDAVMESIMEAEGSKWSSAGRSLHRLGDEGPALAGRFICYDSGFTREDKLLEQRELAAESAAGAATAEAQVAKPVGHAGDGLASMRTHSTPIKSAGHAGDGLASMRTHSTPIKSAGHAGDGLASMRTHSTPVKSAGHAGDGLASMRTHSTPVKSAGHAGDGLASMRTHSTPVKSAGHAGDGLASMRTHSTPVKSAGHAGDGLASMRTHSTPVKSAGHAGDGLASMRTHSTPVKSAGHAGDGLASMRTHSTPVKSAGHAGDGLASMRTHSTPVKSAGHAGDGLASMRTHSTPVKSAGHAGDGLASMRTHSTPVKSAGHAGDGLASMRTHSTPVKSAGHAGDGLATARTYSATARPVGMGDQPALGRALPGSIAPARATSEARAHSTETVPSSTGIPEQFVLDKSLLSAAEADTGAATATGAADVALHPPAPEAAAEDDVGEYWLPWHIDSNFATILHREMYAYEHDASFAPEPEDAGLLMMNEVGDVAKCEPDRDAVLLQMGAFGQIYSGGVLAACRHAVVSPRPPGIARFNYCNFWYAQWNTVCDTPVGFEHRAVNRGWNAMMDDSYLDITMKQGFASFRKFMVSPEAEAQFADTVRFKELSEFLPMPARVVPVQAAALQAERRSDLVIDVLTDVRCPFSALSQRNLDRALESLGLRDHVVFRYHPVFLNPNVPKEGESLDDYLLREYGYSKEYAHSENYPIRLAGLEAGIRFNPHRRVVNTFDAFCLIEVASAVGKQDEVVKALSQRYFEEAEDISDPAVLRLAAEQAGLSGEMAEAWMKEESLRQRVQDRYEQLSAKVGEVPHFLLRERASGSGVEVGGNKSVGEWEQVLEKVLEKSRFMGMSVPGPHGAEVWLAEANPRSPVSLAFPAQHGWAPADWPFGPDDFSRMDESPDMDMYSKPRFVQHLDEASLDRLTEVYRSAFRAAPRGFAALDLCSSWTSHYPQEQLEGARVAVHGLNEAELARNKQATERHVQDLNADARLPWDNDTFDFVTLALSVQYLTDPRAVLEEMHRVTKPGGMAIVAFSHRCFLEKCVRVWAEETYDGEGHAHIVARYFQHGPRGGWENLSGVDASPQHGDPIWFVTATKAASRK